MTDQVLRDALLGRLGTAAEKSRVLVMSYATLVVVALGLVDYATGYEVAFSVFYLLPISTVGWLLGWRNGLSAAGMSVVSGLAADLASGHEYSSPFIPYVNMLVRFTLFVMTTALVVALKHEHEKVRAFATLDPLTDIPNSRSFRMRAVIELARMDRIGSPLTLGYMDLDNFKAVNDRFGHREGDRLLQIVASTIQSQIRLTDMVSRVGGDEFALLLPDTGQEDALEVLHRVRDTLVERLHQERWPVTVSLGAITFSTAPGSPDEMLQRADELMYAAKRGGKDAIVLASSGRASQSGMETVEQPK